MIVNVSAVHSVTTKLLNGVSLAIWAPAGHQTLLVCTSLKVSEMMLDDV